MQAFRYSLLLYQRGKSLVDYWLLTFLQKPYQSKRFSNKTKESETIKTQAYSQNQKPQFFLARLLVLVCWPYFCFALVGLVLGLAISGIRLIGVKVAIGFLK